jgi:peptide chain release factor 2
MGEAEGDTEIVTEAETALTELVKTAEAKELEALLNGEADANDTFLEINAGAGGTESCDWASMLARMYVRWAEKRGYTVELQSESEGEGAGIKSASYKISGHNAYGWLKTEAGVHRLVRISPYDSAARRHTSFSRSGSTRSLTTTSRSRCRTRTSASTPSARLARAAST